MAFPRLGKMLTQTIFNGILDRLEGQNNYQHGRGVLNGLEVSAGAGLTIDVSAGWMVATAPVLVAAQTAVVVPASATVFVFIASDGTVTTSASSADPGGEVVCLGSVTTDGAGVTSVSDSMRQALARFSALRVWEVGAGVLVVNTEARTVTLAGGLELMTEFSTLTATKTLDALSADVHRIQCVAGQKVQLPDPDNCGDGRIFQVVNDNGGGGADVTVRDDTDSTTVATVTPGSRAVLMKSFDKTAWVLR